MSALDTEIVKAVLGTGGLLVPVGGAIAFVWRKVEKRFRRIERDLKACQLREKASEKRRAVQLTVIELLWLKVKESDPFSPALDRARHLLDGLKQPPPDDPELTMLALRLDDEDD